MEVQALLFDAEKTRRVIALVPAFNAAATVGATVAALKLIKLINEIIVIDDGSSDGTDAEAEKAGAQVIRLSQNRGKGGALNAGLAKVINANAKSNVNGSANAGVNGISNDAAGAAVNANDIVALVDSDLGSSAAEFEKLIEPVLKNQADMTIARFPKAERKGGFGLLKKTAQNGLKLFTGIKFDSPLSGQRVLNARALQAIGSFESGWGVEVGMTIDVCRNGLRVREVPVQMKHSETGRDLAGFKHRGKQFLGVIKVFAKRLMTR